MLFDLIDRLQANWSKMSWKERKSLTARTWIAYGCFAFIGCIVASIFCSIKIFLLVIFPALFAIFLFICHVCRDLINLTKRSEDD